MSANPGKPLSRFRNIAFACWLSLGIGQSGIGQTNPGPDFQKLLVKRVFKQCPVDNPGSKSGKIEANVTEDNHTYYFGPIARPAVACPPKEGETECEEILEFKDVEFRYQNALTAADHYNGLQAKGAITMNFSSSRSRQIADGVWLPWSVYSNHEDSQPWAIGELQEKDGIWSSRLGVDLQPMGGLHVIAQSSDLSVEEAETAKERVTCNDLSNARGRAVARPEIPPPHVGGPAQSAGEAAYKANCQGCHGTTGTPFPAIAKMMGVKPSTDPTYKNESEADMIAAVKNGKGKMMAMSPKLTDARIKDAVDYFRNLK